MRQESKQNASRALGKDEMNLAEFPLSVVGKRSPGNRKTIQFEDRVWDRAKREYVARKLTITGSDLLGLPNSMDDEVLLACVQLTKQAGFADRKLRFSRYALLDCIGWKPDGRSYRRLAESLDRWAGTLVISDKAYWDKANRCWIKDSFNILDRVLLADCDTGESARARSAIVWGDFMWRSFQAGNLKELDFDFWLSLQSPVAKRLYRLLDKRFYFGRTVSFDLHDLAWEKIGLSRNMHTGQIKEKLQPAHRELRDREVCRAEFKQRARGQWDVVYGKFGGDSPPASERSSQLGTALVERGVRNGHALASKHAPEKIVAAIENFDDRRANGQQVGPGWLGKAIVDPDGFQFRTGYRTKKQRDREKLERTRKAAADQQKLQDLEQERRSVTARHRERQEAFLAFLGSRTPEELEQLELRGIEAALKAGKRVLAKHVRECRLTNEPLSSAGPLRRELWWCFIINQPHKQRI